MGKEWYWSRSVGREEKEGPGCMSSMFHFFDLQHILFTTRNTRASQESSPKHHQRPPPLKGVEAPRNSLELDQTAAGTTSTSAFGDDYQDVPFGVQILPAPSLLKKKKNDFLITEEKSNSPQAVTPRSSNVVARLMGLEVLPDEPSTPTMVYESKECYNKSVVLREKKKQCIDESRMQSPSPRHPLQKRDGNILHNLRSETGFRSLPETPRTSSERPRDGDPRLSFQINKENTNRLSYLCEVPGDNSPNPCSPSPKMAKSRKKDCSKLQDENKSPRSHYYAREIVKQVKESISKRGSNPGDENGTRSRRTKPMEVKVAQNNESKPFTVKSSSPSCSPPPYKGFLEPPKLPSRPASSFRENVEAKVIKIGSSKCQKAGYERFTERIKRQAPPSETAATRSDAFTSTLQSSSISHSNLAGVQQKLFSSSDKTKNTCFFAVKAKDTSHQEPQQATSAKEQDPEFKYVKSILNRAGIMNTTTVRWFSPTLPIDPFVFHQLELDLPLFQQKLILGPLRHRWNRKLLFHLVEEILGDLLSTPSAKPKEKSLLERLWSQIRRCPLADCQVVSDIDALVAGDLSEGKMRLLLNHPSVVAEKEDIALEIEQDVIDSILGEAAASIALNSRR